MKKIIISLLALAVMLPLWGFEFAADKQTKCEIAVAEHPNRLEKMAADDLKKFLSKMSGAEFKIIPESEVKGPAIYVGETKFAAKHGIDFSLLNDEEWVIKAVGKDLILTGGRPVGAFYAVWALLKKLGCWSLTMDQDVIPSRPALVQDNLDEQRNPAFAGRVISTDFPGKAMIAKIPSAGEKAYNLWMLRSGMNGSQTNRTTPYYLGKMYNISHWPYSHTLSLYVDPDKYFKTHPEYFAMDANGKRYRPQGAYSSAHGSLCMSNPEVWRITLDSLRKKIENDRRERKKEDWPCLYDISILDATPFICKCPKCKAISEAEGSECGLLLRYINYVATKIAKEYPGIIIRTFAYSATRIQPKITKPAPNVLLFLCDEFPVSDAYRPLTSKLNTHRLKDLKKWQALGNNLMVWDYWNIGQLFNPPRVEVLIDAIAPDMRLFRDLGLKAIYIEAERDFVSPQNFIDLEYFVATALMMDPDQDVEKLIDIFMNGYYGPAAPAMKDWLNKIRAGVKAHPKRQTILNTSNWSYITPRFMVDSYLQLKRTAEKLPENSIYRHRVEDEMITPMWAALVKRPAMEAAFKKAGINMDDMIKECRKYVSNHIHRYNGKNLGFIEKMFVDKFKRVTLRLPRPEKFRNVPDEKIRLIGYPHTNKKGSIIDDPDSITGKALKSYSSDPLKHGVNRIVNVNGKVLVPATKFSLSNIGAPGSISTVIRRVPRDEKYHWYKLDGKIDLRERSYFWGHVWDIEFDTSPFYVLADGVADNNVWECWVSAKFTGPAYVPGSKKKNNILVDMMVLVKPGVPLN